MYLYAHLFNFQNNPESMFYNIANEERRLEGLSKI